MVSENSPIGSALLLGDTDPHYTGIRDLPHRDDEQAIARFHADVSIDQGDDAVNADAALAERDILARVRGVDYVGIKRTMNRSWLNGEVEVKAEWTVYFTTGDDAEAHGAGDSLSEAVADAMAAFDAKGRRVA